MSGPTINLGKLAEFVPPEDAFARAGYAALESLRNDVLTFANGLHKAGHVELAKDLLEILENNNDAVVLGDLLP